MAGFSSYNDVDAAKLHTGVHYKTLTNAGAARAWYDDTMMGGGSGRPSVPPQNLYASAPLAAAILNPKNGIRHHTYDPNSSEHLLEIVMNSNGGSEGTCTYFLCDYVLYYPFIDCDSTDLQELDNTVTLTRHTSGTGLRAMIVAQQAGSANGTFTLSYTNDSGVSGRTATGVVQAFAQPGQVGLSGSLLANQVDPFISLAEGDTGIRSVESIQWDVAPGGFCAIVLVKRIAAFTTAEAGGTMEQQYYTMLPEIHGEAYLGLMRQTAGAPSSGRYFFGQITTIKGT